LASVAGLEGILSPALRQYLIVGSKAKRPHNLTIENLKA